MPLTTAAEPAAPPMVEYEVKWHQCPYRDYPAQVLYIEAASPTDAKAIAEDHVRRTYGITWFNVWPGEPARPRPAGRVMR